MKLRLDTAEASQADLGGYHAIVPGQPKQSELVRRITTDNPDDKMPPPDSGKTLSKTAIQLLTAWIAEGATYSPHWAYVKPVRPALPRVRHPSWAKNEIDLFILDRLQREGLKPSAEADRATLIRRVSLDLTGLPPSLAELAQFEKDRKPGAYERLVDRLLAKKSFGEHWARLWLDQARYADSAGYADDPPRTIWAYRDYVIRALNRNTPFDQFTIDQLAGDLLPEPTEEEEIATGFHRNTMTNNEGGTSDEEFRNVAIVDRVNTTMAVWMGTTMACAQCHNHKYDPITQKDYFRLFAIFNNTEDADRTDESPVLPLYTAEQKLQRQDLAEKIGGLETVTQTPTPELTQAQARWEKDVQLELPWSNLHARAVRTISGAEVTLANDNSVRVGRGGKTDVYTVELQTTTNLSFTALRLEALPDESLPAKGPGYADGDFILSRVRATATPPPGTPQFGRYVRLELPGNDRILSLAEVQVFQGTNNLALLGQATQSSTAFGGRAELAIDGNTNGNFAEAKSTTHTEQSKSPWWELDLKATKAINRIVLWNRTDGDTGGRLKDVTVTLLDEKREPVWQQTAAKAPSPSAEFALDGPREISFAAAYADYSREKFDAANVLDGKEESGWSIAPQVGKRHAVTLVPKFPAELPPGATLTLTLEQLSKTDYATLGRFRLAVTSDPRAPSYAAIPASVLTILHRPAGERTDSDRIALTRYYLTIAPALADERERLADFRKELEEVKPFSTVPIQRELAGDKRRKTHLQHRGNYLDLGEEVTEGLPSAFHPAAAGANPNRLTLARWLVNTNNPLTARVAVNRLWGAIFGVGIVRTSEDFGTQGEPPSNPQLLDWLATEYMQSHWDTKHLLKLMVTSAAYRQSSQVSAKLEARDPDNRLLARGPRFRLSAEMVRDQALAVSGLLSDKMYGPPVKPPQPKLGLSAAFGSATDWETSPGEDSHRRALYTMWRRSSPYPSLATFDAPNREVCTVRRERSNTPLQALVTLNDPVYFEAAQALARRMIAAGTTRRQKLREGFRLCLSRPPTWSERSKVLALYKKTRAYYAGNLEKARSVAGQPKDTKARQLPDLAAWTVVANVLLNLDETLMKR